MTADIKTIAAHECYGVSCITALTVQSTHGVSRIEGVDPKIIVETLQELVSDVGVSAVHIGMLGNAQVVEAVAGFFGQNFPGGGRLPAVVLEPIFERGARRGFFDGGGCPLVIQRSGRPGGG